ncbi:olfactory receptor 4E2-like [Ambystoma mexicanum]|uniref:olfactory receptor 4E2-like n=1 Tax=Ambystoma mexicanum TaxID=8296 RepID=UPI0037E82DAE
MGNETTIEDFVLLGLSRNHNVQIMLFFIFILFYIATLFGNVLIMVTVNADSSLHSPMYFFLSNLSFIDLCYPSVTTPKMLVNLLSKDETISFNGCIAQIFFFHLFACAEIFLLTVMAFDRYIAICNPLRYASIMSRTTCILLVFSCWAGGAVHSIVQTWLMMTLPFCGPNEVDHFFCDILPLLKLACNDTYITGVLIVSNSGLISLVCFILLLVSYICILHSVRHRSAEGKHKALSTCAAHLTVVTIFFGPCIFIYTRPSTTFPLDKSISVFYAIMTPMLNPLIYTLRNTEVKSAMKRILSRKMSVQKT